MTINVQAVYENGVLRPVDPLPLREREKVKLTVQRSESLADQTYGMIGWTGNPDTFDSILKESENDLLEKA